MKMGNIKINTYTFVLDQTKFPHRKSSTGKLIVSKQRIVCLL